MKHHLGLMVTYWGPLTNTGRMVEVGAQGVLTGWVFSVESCLDHCGCYLCARGPKGWCQ